MIPMIKIRPEQIDIFRPRVRDNFILQLHDYLIERVPSYFQDTEVAISRESIKMIVMKAEKCGFLERDHIRRYALVHVAASKNPDVALPVWFEDIANKERPSAPLRLLELEDALLHLGRTSTEDIR